MTRGGRVLKKPLQHVVLAERLAEGSGRELRCVWDEAIRPIIILIFIAHSASFADPRRPVQNLFTRTERRPERSIRHPSAAYSHITLQTGVSYRPGCRRSRTRAAISLAMLSASLWMSVSQ